MVKLLLDERYAPITSTIGFLETEVDVAAQAYHAWMEEILNLDNGFSQERISGNLADVLSTLPPLCTPVPMKTLFVPTAGNWTAFFDNGRLGTDAAGPTEVLAERIGCRALYATSVPNTMSRRSTKGRYGANMLEVFGDDGELIRTICSANDGGKWVFHQSGPPFDFEDVSFYEERKIKDRFTPELLSDYVKYLGIDLFEESFYMPDVAKFAILHCRTDRTDLLAGSYTEYSLEEIQQGFGFSV